MNRIIVLHSEHEAQSRDFIKNIPADTQIVRWYSEDPLVDRLRSMGVSTQTFPAVCDTNSLKVVVQPESWDAAIAELSGLGSNALETRKAETDLITKTLLEGGLVYKGKIYSTTLIHQAAHAADMVMIDCLTFPHEVKATDDSIVRFSSAVEFKKFYKEFTEHIRDTRQSGWKVKAALSKMSVQELIDFKDPRSGQLPANARK